MRTDAVIGKDETRCLPCRFRAAYQLGKRIEVDQVIIPLPPFVPRHAVYSEEILSQVVRQANPMALFELGQLHMGRRDGALDALAGPHRLEPSERFHQTVELPQAPPAHLWASPAKSLFRSAMGSG